MCYSFEFLSPKEKIKARFGLTEYPEDATYSFIRPTNFIPVITAPGQANQLIWGIPAPWDGKPLVNARSETLGEKQTFKPLLNKRCLVPATGYFEWRKADEKKFKNLISVTDQDLFAFAGLTDGKHVTIATCAPAPEIVYIHHRMPVILNRDVERQWLDNSLPFDAIVPLLCPYQGDKIKAEEEVPIVVQPDLFG